MEASPAPSTTSTPESTPQAAPTQEAGFTPDPSKVATPGPITPYQPNLKFSVANKEQEFDPLFKDIVKTKEMEDKLRDLYTKAGGLDFVKNQMTEKKLEAQTYKEQAKTMKPSYDLHQDVNMFLKNKDYNSLFDTLKIPDAELFRYVHNRLEQSELPPHQQQELQRQQELTRRSYQLEKQNQFLQQSYQQEVVQARHNQLDSALAKPEFGDFVSSFDSRAGRPGAFKDEVIARGYLHFQRTQQDIPIEQAVQEVLQLAGYQGGMSAPQASQPMAAPQQPSLVNPGKPQARAQAPVAKPVIPNVSGRGTSPTKQSPKSLAELRELAKNM